MQRLIEAAKELTRYLWKVQDWGGTYVEMCIDNVDAAISDAERKAADDALPATYGWVMSEFSGQLDETKRFVSIGDLTEDGSLSLGIDKNTGICFILAFYAYRVDGWRDLPHIRTRKQFRDLVSLLKGGEA